MSLELLLHAAEFLELQETKDLKGDDEKSAEIRRSSSDERADAPAAPLAAAPPSFKSSSAHKSTMAALDIRPPLMMNSSSTDVVVRRAPSPPEDPHPPFRRGSIPHGYCSSSSPSPAAAAPLGSTCRRSSPSPVVALQRAPIQVPQQAAYFSVSSQDTSFSTSPSNSPSNSSSGGDSISSSLSFVSAFRSNATIGLEGGAAAAAALSFSGQRRSSFEPSAAPPQQLPSPHGSLEGDCTSASSQYQMNGFIRVKPLNSLGKSALGAPAALEHDHEHEDEGSPDTKDELVKKRAGSTPSREVHNKLEKNRRAHLKECFEALRRQLPCMEDKKISNQTILKNAQKTIANLKRREKENEIEMESLARQKIANQQHLSTLKKELQNKWDHLDDISKILPDMSSLDQHREDTKSTTTASEQPDLEEDSRDSLRLSGHTPETSSGTYLQQLTSAHPVDLTPSNSISDKASFLQADRECYPDPNQPLNLSTNTPTRSPRRMAASPSSTHPPPQQIRVNGEWSNRRTSAYPLNYPQQKSPTAHKNPTINKTLASPTIVNASNKFSDPNLGLNVTRMIPISTNSPHISHMINPATVLSTVSAAVTDVSSMVKSGTTMSHMPAITKVVTTLPHLSTLTPVGATISNLPSTIASNLGQIHFTTSDSSVPVRANVAHIANGGASITRVSSAVNTTVSMASSEHHLPIVGGSGIQLPAHLVTNGVHLTGPTGSIIGQPAIQVITPEGYKLIPAEHAPNGVKPVTFALAQPGLEHLSTNVEDGKHTPVMVAVNKNGLPAALHLTVPATARAIATNTSGNNIPATSLPLNLTMPGSTQTVKVTQAGSTNLISSYIPLTHSNGLTRLVQGMNVVGPLVVSQSHRAGSVMVPANINTANTKILKGQATTGGVVVSTAGGAATALPLAQYATTLTGGLVNSVVVVSTTTAGPLVSSSMTISTAKN